MKNLSRYKKYTEKFFQKIPDVPVDIKPFEPETKQIAQRYKKLLDRLLARFGLTAQIRGSVGLEIAGKGEIDLRIFVPDKRWFDVTLHLINYYRRVENLEEEYIRFIDFYEECEIEIGLVCGQTALVEKKLFKYLKNHLDILKNYVEIKRKYAFSKREYARQKHKFFKSVISKLK